MSKSGNNQPGFMLYFDDFEDTLVAEFDDNALGSLLRAIIEYERYGALPEFSDKALRILWHGVKVKLDRDAEKYQETCIKKKYSRYCGTCKSKDVTPLDYDEWYKNVYSEPE